MKIEKLAFARLRSQDENSHWAGNKSFDENIVIKINELIDAVNKLTEIEAEEQEIKRCPWCAEIPVAEQHGGGYGWLMHFSYDHEYNCCFTQWNKSFETEKDCIEAWNKRA